MTFAKQGYFRFFQSSKQDSVPCIKNILKEMQTAYLFTCLVLCRKPQILFRVFDLLLWIIGIFACLFRRNDVQKQTGRDKFTICKISLNIFAAYYSTEYYKPS